MVYTRSVKNRAQPKKPRASEAKVLGLPGRVAAIEEPEAVKSDGASQEIDSITFKNGENILTIRYSKGKNRTYKIQFFLNGAEIKPVTHQANKTADMIWNMLKVSVTAPLRKGEGS